MSANIVSPLLHTLDPPSLSSPDDHEILIFFEKELNKIREEHNLPSSWCPEADVAVLVKLADGLWIYVDTVTRFIGDPNSSGPTSPCAQSRQGIAWRFTQESTSENGHVLWPYHAPDSIRCCPDCTENLVA